jgi:hypothetical protein
MRAARRAAATLLLALALTLLAGGAVSAATPAPTPPADAALLTFRGVGVSTGGEGDTPDQNGITVVVDCRTGTCLLTVTADTPALNGAAYVFSGPNPLVLVGGHGVYDLPASGDYCAGSWVGPGRLVVDATSAGLHITQTLGAGHQACADYTAGSYALDAALVSGELCHLDDSCVTPTPVAVASVTPTHHRRDSASPPADQPSVLCNLATVTEAFTAPNILWAAGGTVVLVLLVAFPSSLLDSATEKGAERLAAWRARRRGARGATAPTEGAPRSGVAWRTLPVAALGVVAASLISSFIDPTFGFNIVGLRVFLSIFASFLLDAVAAWFLLIWVVRRRDPGAAASFRFTPASLIVVTIAVLFTRLTGFQPGIVFGLVAGVAFGSVLADAVKARLALIGLGYSFVLGLAGWFGYSALVGAIDHPSVLALFIEELLAAMAIGGIAALPISLVPLRGLLGGEIFAWKKGAWAAAYALGLLAFFLVLMPKPFSWTTVGLSVWVWGGLFAAYAVVAVALWLVLARPWRRSDPVTDPT